MATLFFPKAHTYGARRPDGYQNCSWCTPWLRVRVPATATGRQVHSEVHNRYGGTPGDGSGFTDVFQEAY